MDQGNRCFRKHHPEAKARIERKARSDCGRVAELRAKVWSGRRLLPLLAARVVVEVVARGEKAPASRTHSKRFAPLRSTWYVAPAFGAWSLLPHLEGAGSRGRSVGVAKAPASRAHSRRFAVFYRPCW